MPVMTFPSLLLGSLVIMVINAAVFFCLSYYAPQLPSASKDRDHNYYFGSDRPSVCLSADIILPVTFDLYKVQYPHSVYT